MIFYSREKKTLIIPDGFDGNTGSGSGDCATAIAIARAEGYNSGYAVGYESGEASGKDEGYDSGYTAGFAEGTTNGEALQKAKLTSTAITVNGTYSREDGFSTVSVNVPSDCEEEYFRGVRDGAIEQKGRLSATTITTNGTYSRADGWNEVTVNVQGQGPRLQTKTEELIRRTQTFYPDEGYDGLSSIEIDGRNFYNNAVVAGKEAQKALLSSTAITSNGTYTTDGDGWSAVTVDVPAGCALQNRTYTLQDGMNYSNVLINPETGYDGMSQVVLNADAAVDYGKYLQKNQMATTTITTNGTYTRTDGYRQVVVDVPVYSLYAFGTITASTATTLTAADLQNNPMGLGYGSNDISSLVSLSSATLSQTYVQDLITDQIELPAGEYYFEIRLSAGNQLMSNCSGDGAWVPLPIGSANECLYRVFTLGGMNGEILGFKLK